jgi:type II secretory pathway component PulM
VKFDSLFILIRDYWQDRASRKKIVLVVVLIGLYTLIIPNLLWERASEGELSELTAKYHEFSTLTDKYRSLRASVNAIEQKKTLTKTSSITQAIGDISLSLGIKEKMKSVKLTGTKKVMDQISEESAEIQMEKLNMSEVVNLFYKIENAPMILAVKKVSIKKSFENPELLDVTMSVSLFGSS